MTIKEFNDRNIKDQICMQFKQELEINFENLCKKIEL